MVYRRFGDSELKISQIGFGCTRFPASDLAGEEGLEKCAQLVCNALKKGINLFDVAPTYARGKAETILGRAFRMFPGRVHVNAKSISYDDPSAKDVRRRLEASLSIMGLNQFTFYTMWAVKSMEHYREIIKPEGPFNGVYQAKKEGLVQKILISCHCDEKTTWKILSEGYFDGVILSHNLLQRSVDGKEGTHGITNADLIKEAGRLKKGVFIMNPLAGGLIAENPQIFGENAVEQAYAFLLSNPNITSVLAGVKNFYELEENIQIADRVISDHIQITYTGSQKGHFCTKCQYCSNCPAGIPIHRYMDAYNKMLLSKLENTDQEPQFFYADILFGSFLQEGLYIPDNAQNPCLKCGQCEKKCTQNLPIIKRLDEIFALAKTYGFYETCIKERIRPLFSEDQIGIYPCGYHTQNLMNYLSSCNRHPAHSRFLFFDDVGPDERRFFNGQLVHPIQCVNEFALQKLLISDFYREDQLRSKVKQILNPQIELLSLYKESGNVPPSGDGMKVVRLF